MQAQIHAPPTLQAQSVAHTEVKAFGILQAQVGCLCDHTGGAVKTAGGHVAHDECTERVARIEARVERRAITAIKDLVRRGAGHRLVDLDLVVVQRDRQTGNKFWLPDQADGRGVGFLRVEVGIATAGVADLPCSRRWHIAELRQRHACDAAQVGERSGRVGLGGANQSQLARINGAIGQPTDDRLVQLVDVGRACRTLLHGAETQSFDRGVVQAVLPAAIGLAADRGLELALAVATFEVQRTNAHHAACQRHDGLEETFLERQLAPAVRQRRAGTQDFAVDLRWAVRQVAGRHDALFHSEGQRHGCFCEGALQHAQVAIDCQTFDCLSDGRGLNRGLVEERQHRRRDGTCGAEGIERYAAASGHRASPGRDGAQRLLQLGSRAPVDTRRQLVGCTLLQVGVVAPAVQEGQSTAQTGGPLRRCVVEVVDARAVLYDAAADIERDLLGVAHDAIRRRDGEGSAQLGAHRCGDERVSDRQSPVREAGRGERSGGRKIQRNLALGLVELGIRFSELVDGEATDGRHLRPLQRSDVVIERVEVEGIDVAVVGPQVATRHVDDLVAGQRRRDAAYHGGYRDGRPARKTCGGTDRDQASRALSLRQWVGTCGTKTQRNVAAAIGQIGSDRYVGAVTLGVTLLGSAVGGLRLDAAEVLFQYEVDNAGNGVCAVHRRSTAGDQVNAFKQCHRDGVGVDPARQVSRDGAPAVDQHQRALGPYATQVDRGDAARAIVGARADGWNGRRKATDDFFHCDGLRRVDLGSVDAGNRAVGRRTNALDARARDFDAIGRLRMRRQGTHCTAQGDKHADADLCSFEHVEIAP